MLNFNLKASNTEYRTKTFTSEHLVNYSGALAYPRNNKFKAERLVCPTQGPGYRDVMPDSVRCEIKYSVRSKKLG